MNGDSPIRSFMRAIEQYLLEPSFETRRQVWVECDLLVNINAIPEDLLLRIMKLYVTLGPM